MKDESQAREMLKSLAEDVAEAASYLRELGVEGLEGLDVELLAPPSAKRDEASKPPVQMPPALRRHASAERPAPPPPALPTTTRPLPPPPPQPSQAARPQPTEARE